MLKLSTISSESRKLAGVVLLAISIGGCADTSNTWSNGCPKDPNEYQPGGIILMKCMPQGDVCRGLRDGKSVRDTTREMAKKACGSK
jgi:hypothetical protein